MKLSKIDRVIIQDLVKAAEGLYVFTLYRRYKISPKELFMAINKLEVAEIIENNDSRIILTKKGVYFAIKKQISHKGHERLTVPSFSKGPRIKINEFYIPIDFEL